MSGKIFYALLCSFGIGIFLASLTPVSHSVILGSLFLSLVFGLMWRRRRRTSSLFLYISIILLGVGLGLFRMDIAVRKESSFSHVENTEVEIFGVVSREPDVRTVSQHLYIREIESDELILVTTDPFIDVHYGDSVLVAGVVELPKSFETDLGRTFNYPAYLRARGVTHRISYGEVSVLERGGGNVFIGTLLSFKHMFMDSIQKIIPEPEAGLSEGLLLGVKRALGDDLEDAFRRTGIIHIVVLSGYNIMIVVESIMRLLSFFTTPRVRMVIGGGAILSFALIVGFSATVVRASLMATIVLVARSIGRRYAILRALTFAGVAMVLLNPYLLVFDPGFQLSFLATLGLVVIAPAIEKFFIRVPTKFQIREFVMATIATQIAVLPLLLYLMGEFSTVAVLVNVLVLPIVPLAMLFAFLSGMFGFAFSLLGTIFGFVAYGMLGYIISVATFFAGIPFASFAVPTFPFWIVVVAYGVIGLVLWKYRLREDVPHISKIKKENGVPEVDISEWTIEDINDVQK